MINLTFSETKDKFSNLTFSETKEFHRDYFTEFYKDYFFHVKHSRINHLHLSSMKLATIQLDIFIFNRDTLLYLSLDLFLHVKSLLS